MKKCYNITIKWNTCFDKNHNELLPCKESVQSQVCLKGMYNSGGQILVLSELGIVPAPYLFFFACVGKF